MFFENGKESKPQNNEREVAIRVRELSKKYQIYDTPIQRLKQFVFPQLRKFFRLENKQYFREFSALQNISFEVTRGQTVGVIGRNGSGKSTLLQIICGTLYPSAGDVEVNGRVAALLELGSGFNPDFTGRENVYFNASILGQSEEITRSKFSAIESFADIGDFIDQPVKNYSSGMMVRLAFSVIAHVDADILIIDEALAVGDAFFTQKCMRFLREFMATGTVFFVSHDLGAVKNLCTDAVWIDKGILRYAGDSRAACDLYIEELFGQMSKDVDDQDGDSSHKSAADEINISNDKNIEPKNKENSANKVPKGFFSNQTKKDVRSDLLDRSVLRNDIRVFDFDVGANSFHTGLATIENVYFGNMEGKPLAYIIGGETITLEVKVKAHADIESPIVGFYLKDRLGQNIFGENTWLSYCDEYFLLPAGNYLTARFVFDMPRLNVGDYSITVSFAEGTQESFIQHHWIHDALHFTSQSSSVFGALIGIPMQEVVMQTFPPKEDVRVSGAGGQL
ncbi:ABC transporter ATP-binding protein [Comamonas composti]|uniref:ABC transporter ATP-binding protein n=1 Tax=Comamonas composti TaxID=408558 RepID=UPI0003FB16BC|nr:ABC transporter ATP-binding protein [Comamonas composti]